MSSAFTSIFGSGAFGSIGSGGFTGTKGGMLEILLMHKSSLIASDCDRVETKAL